MSPAGYHSYLFSIVWSIFSRYQLKFCRYWLISEIKVLEKYAKGSNKCSYIGKAIHQNKEAFICVYLKKQTSYIAHLNLKVQGTGVVELEDATIL